MVVKLAFNAKSHINAYGYPDYLRRYTGFYDYYQIGKEHEVDRSKSGSKDEGELIATGMNSPFGVLFQIVKETGWTMHYILWQVSWANIMLMLADRPSFGKKGEVIQKGNVSDLKSRLKQKYGQS